MEQVVTTPLSCQPYVAGDKGFAMMIGRPKTALKKSTGKIRKSSERFAFYLLLNGKDEPLLFCDIKPGKSPIASSTSP